MKETRCDPSFERLLAGFYRQPLDEGDDVIYGVWPDLTLAYSNARWAQFAVENDGADVLVRWTLGASVRSAFGADLDPFYTRAFAEVLATGRIWQHTYTCPSPRQMRWFNMRALPLGRDGLLVWNSLVSAAVLAEPPGRRPSATPYRDTNGMVTQCSHCRRVQVAASQPAQSDWHHVPAFIKRAPSRTTHGLCPICFMYHYKSVLTPDQLRAALEAPSSTPGRPAGKSQAAHRESKN
jgi:hypothetical protein